MPSPSLHPWIVLVPSIVYSIVQPLRNPFQCRVSVQEEGRLSLQSQFSLSLPLCLKEYEIYNALSVHPVYVPLSPPELNVTLGLSSSAAHLSTTPFSFVLHCPSSDASFVLPHSFTLENGACYSIRTVISCVNGEWMVMKRLYPTKWNRKQRGKIYDVHANGRWIRVERDTTTDVTWRDVRREVPAILHYERVVH